MINRIFFDIDETLISTSETAIRDDEVEFFVDEMPYHTIIHPESQKVIDFARELVGFDRVHILTVATRDYAREINRIAGWGFNDEDLFCREDIKSHVLQLPTAWGGTHFEYDPHIYAHKNNVLIDNKPHVENDEKTHFIGIYNSRERYLDVPDYYGVARYPLFDRVQEFLNSLK